MGRNSPYNGKRLGLVLFTLFINAEGAKFVDKLFRMVKTKGSLRAGWGNELKNGK